MSQTDDDYYYRIGHHIRYPKYLTFTNPPAGVPLFTDLPSTEPSTRPASITTVSAPSDKPIAKPTYSPLLSTKDTFKPSRKTSSRANLKPSQKPTSRLSLKITSKPTLNHVRTFKPSMKPAETPTETSSTQNLTDQKITQSPSFVPYARLTSNPTTVAAVNCSDKIVNSSRIPSSSFIVNYYYQMLTNSTVRLQQSQTLSDVIYSVETEIQSQLMVDLLGCKSANNARILKNLNRHLNDGGLIGIISMPADVITGKPQSIYFYLSNERRYFFMSIFIIHVFVIYEGSCTSNITIAECSNIMGAMTVFISSNSNRSSLQLNLISSIRNGMVSGSLLVANKAIIGLIFLEAINMNNSSKTNNQIDVKSGTFISLVAVGSIVFVAILVLVIRFLTGRKMIDKRDEVESNDVDEASDYFAVDSSDNILRLHQWR